MKTTFFLSGALAATILLSAGASAQSYDGPGAGPDYDAPHSSYQGGDARYDRGDADRFFASLRSLDLRDDQRHEIRDIFRDANGDREVAKRRILAVLDGRQRHELFATMRDGDRGAPPDVRYGGYGGGDGRGADRPGDARDGRNVSGLVTYFNAYDLHVENGPRVQLHQGTVITPTGTTIRPGDRIAVSGHFERDGTFDADAIDVRRGRDERRY